MYAKLLRENMERHDARCLLLNTGWMGGPAGQAPRISIRDTRALLNAGLRGDLHQAGMEYDIHPVFGVRVPRSCPEVDAAILDPRASWSDKKAYNHAAEHLRVMFRANFEKNDFAAYGIDAVM